MNVDFSQAIIVLLIIVGSVILHELSHGLIAYWLGDRTAKDAGRLTLNPLKHIDPIMSIVVPIVLYLIGAPVFGAAKPVPVNYGNLKWREWGMALVALAGPFTNFLIALVAFLISHWTGVVNGVIVEIVHINLGFMIFNLIPIPPLDGSRILYALSPDPVRNILSRMERPGIFIVYILILLFGNVFSSVMINGINGVLEFFFMLVGH